MSDELWIKRPCVHGLTGEHDDKHSWPGSWCEGGSEERLDPEQVLIEGYWEGGTAVGPVTVQDVLDALGDQ